MRDHIGYAFDRVAGIWRLAVKSVQTRGWRGTFDRVGVRLKRVPVADRPEI